MKKTTSLTAADKVLLKALGAKLRKIRQDKGWTLEETEDHGWNNWPHLQRIESGKNITLITLSKIGKLYKLSLSDLLKDF